MTIGLVGQDQITTFTSPVNGTSPIDANVVRGNDNTVKTAFNVHDNDASVHLQSSLAASRPPAGVPHRKWLDSDTYRLYFDDGAAWHELAYLPAGGSPTFGDVHITGTLTVDGLTTLHDVHITGAVTVDGPVSLPAGLTAPVVITGVASQLVINASPGPAQLPRIALQQAGVPFGALQWPAPSLLQILDNGGVQVAIFTGGNLSLSGSLTAAGLITGAGLNVSGNAAFGGSVSVGDITVSGAPTGGQGSMSYNATYGVVIRPKTGSLNDFTIVNTAFSAFVLSNPTGTLNIETGGAVKVGQNLNVLGSGAFGSDVAIAGLLTLNRPSLAYIGLNGTGTANANTQIQFSSGGVTQWQLGNNVNVGGNVFELYSQMGGGSTFRVSPSGVVTMPGAVSTGSITASASIATAGWLTVGASTASPVSLVNIHAVAAPNEKDWVLLNNNGGFYINAYDEALSGSGIAFTATRSGITVTSVGLATGGATRLMIDAPGVVFIGPTTTALGASAGEIVLGNGRSLLGANTANNQALPMIAIDGFNHIIMGGGSQNNLIRIGAQAQASLPAASVNNSGGLFVDTTNGRLCYWSGGTRYYLAGTAF